VWNAVSNFCVSVNSVIASSFLLYAVGLSSGSALPLASAMNWVLKDGL
jgi:hypothetical protein